MDVPAFRLGDTLPLALRAAAHDGARRVYTVHVAQVRQYDDGVRYLLCRPGGCCVYLWDEQLAGLLARGDDRGRSPQPSPGAAPARPA